MVKDGNTDPGRVTSVLCASVSFSINGEHFECPPQSLVVKIK